MSHRLFARSLVASVAVAAFVSFPVSQAPASQGGGPTPVFHPSPGLTANPHVPRSNFTAPDDETTTSGAVGGSIAPSAAATTATTAISGRVNVIAGHDVVQKATINSTSVSTCNPGKPTAQNETTIAVNPNNANNLVGGTNDYRLYEPSENRYDGSGGFYTSTDGGATWTVGLLPGLVRGNTSAPGSYESAGDPAIAAGPNNTFWYANLAFNRGDNANSVWVSRSTNGGSTWTSTPVLQTSAAGGATLFNDKEWVAADPTDSTGRTAYVTWTQFHTSTTGVTQSSPIVISKTTDGGAHWSTPMQVSPAIQDQGSQVQVGADGSVYVVFETFGYHGHDWVAWTKSTDGGQTFGSTYLPSQIADIASPLTGHQFRDNSFPMFAIDGAHQYVTWANNNTNNNADVVLIRSANNGDPTIGWTKATVSGGAGNQFFPDVSARNGKAALTWYSDANLTGDKYRARGTVSTDNGSTWETAATLSAPSDVPAGNNFGYPNCAPDFIGDYNAVAVGSDGVAHALWTDIHDNTTTPANTNQNPFTMKLQ